MTYEMFLRDALEEVREVVEGWTDPVISSYEERCDRIRVIVSEALAGPDQKD